MDKKQKKKVQVYKKFALCFPFSYQYRVITGETALYMAKASKLIYDFNTETKASIKFGYNSTMKIVQEEKYNTSKNNIHIVFFFYKENLNTLVNLLMMKARNTFGNNKIYLIDDEEKKSFLSALKIKKMICFTIVKNDKNEKVINGIIDKYETFNCLAINNITPIYQKDVKEITSEK